LFCIISLDTELILLIALKNQLIWITFGMIEDKIVTGDAFREQKFEWAITAV